jgi:sphingosine kinase
VVKKDILAVIYFPLDVKNNSRKRCALEFHMNSPEHATSWASSINEVLLGSGGRRRHILVLVNPFGGTKRAPMLWENVVKPMWELAGVTFEKIETQYSGHAREIAQRLDLTKYTCLTTLSGDGLFWELINGLLMRKDWEDAVKIPVAVMPGGSGNALAYAAKMGDVETAAFTVARGRARPFDVATVTQEKHRFAAFLMTAWGIVADVDFESERFRWMGGARFTVSAVQRIFSLRMYKGKFSYYAEKDWSLENASRCTNKSNCPRCLTCDYRGGVTGIAGAADEWENSALELGGGMNR